MKVEILVAQLCLTFTTQWTVAHQFPLSMEFSRQEYWSSSHFLFWGIFLTQGSNPGSPVLQTDFLLSICRTPCLGTASLNFFFHILFFLIHKSGIFGSNCFYFFVLRHYVVSGRKSVSKKKQGSEKGI